MSNRLLAIARLNCLQNLETALNGPGDRDSRLAWSKNSHENTLKDPELRWFGILHVPEMSNPITSGDVAGIQCF